MAYQPHAVVTGSSGFLGRSLLEELAARGWTVTGLDVQPPPTDLPPGVQWHAGDLCEPGVFEEAATGADVAFHLAARITLNGDPDGLARRVNVGGVERVIDAVRKGRVGRLIYCSTHRLLASGDRPVTAYERTKAEGLKLVESASARGLDACTVGPATLLGPGDYGPSSMGLVLVALWRGDIHAIVTGRQYWVDVRDVARALVWAAVAGSSTMRYTVTGTELSLRELVATAARCGGHRPPSVVVPRTLARCALPIVRPWIRTGAPITRDAMASLRPYRRSTSVSATEVPLPATPLERTLADAQSFFAQMANSPTDPAPRPGLISPSSSSTLSGGMS